MSLSSIPKRAQSTYQKQLLASNTIIYSHSPPADSYDTTQQHTTPRDTALVWCPQWSSTITQHLLRINRNYLRAYSLSTERIENKSRRLHIYSGVSKAFKAHWRSRQLSSRRCDFAYVSPKTQLLIYGIRALEFRWANSSINKVRKVVCKSVAAVRCAYHYKFTCANKRRVW